MFRGFNVTVQSCQDYYYKIGLKMFDEFKSNAIKQLDKYVGVDGTINGSELESDWFGEINAHIFISHSHDDERLAIALAGYLFEKHNIKCFIDSCIWGYSNELLRMIDNKYCWNAESKMYNYNTRNYSTSHVHMMLSAALNKMIDKCEVLFLLNTPESIQTSDILNETDSPWIYSEILASKLIEKKTPQRHKTARIARRVKKLASGERMDEALKVKYKLDLDHLSDLSEEEIINWGIEASSSPENAMDLLYHQKPAPKKHQLL